MGDLRIAGRRPGRAGAALAWLLAFAAAFLPFLRERPPVDWRFARPPPVAAAASRESFFERRFVSEERLAGFVHAPSLAETAGGDLLAVWYGGSGEASADVSLFMARLRRGAAAWDPPRLLFDRAAVEEALGRRTGTIGNPVLLRDGQDRIWLFFVTALLGWASSSINLAVSEDGGDSWTPPRRLVTSPLLDLSTLVRGTPVLYRDGGIGLPVHRELVNTFAMLLRLDPMGRLRDMVRLSWDGLSLQPIVLPLGARRAVALLRPRGSLRGAALLARTANGGRTWSPPELARLPNPGSAMAGLSLDDRRLLVALNEGGQDRRALALAVSEDAGVSWRLLPVVEAAQDAGEGTPEMSYPSLLRAADGTFHLAYAWRGILIRHVRFNAAWLEAQLAP